MEAKNSPYSVRCGRCRNWFLKSNMYRKANRDKYYYVCKVCYRAYKHKYRYNLTEPEFLTILKQQDYKCDICKKELQIKHHVTDSIAKNDIACVDHCHSMGLVRGILCNSCNVGIGLFNDDINIFESAILYLEKAKNQTSQIGQLELTDERSCKMVTPEPKDG